MFYYTWYGNPQFDGKWMHWNHKVFDDTHREHKPPKEIAAAFYPQLGPYSCRDPAILDAHMKMYLHAGAGVVVHSWWGRNGADSQGSHTDDDTLPLLDAAHRHKLRVAFHLEPYEGRNALTVRRDLEYLHTTYGAHPACARIDGRLVTYIYDSYLVPAREWRTVLHPKGAHTIRGEPSDSFLIGLVVESSDMARLDEAGFDGAYTYFAADGFTFGSSPANWGSIAAWAKRQGKLFVPCAGPGYTDVCIRPWNPQTTRGRENGAYYRRMLDAALAQSEVIGITSFNEWHEGTQVEPAVRRASYESYGDPDMYLRITREYSDRMLQHKAGR